MIQTREELLYYIKTDNAEYDALPWKVRLVSMLCRYPNYEIMRYKTLLRKAEFHYNNASKNKIHFLMALLYDRRKNNFGKKLGIEIEHNCFGPGLVIYHGGIVVNPNSRIGKNCKLHGGNCIGNNGKTKDTPVIGDDLDLGYGACIIGDVKLANDIRIGCNAVVVSSCTTNGVVLVGIPAIEKNRR